METLWRDLRQSLRGLGRSPGFTAAAVASLALGIGANTLIFTFLNALFLTPLPVAAPERLVALYSTDPQNPGFLELSYPNVRDLAQRVGAFSGTAAYRNASASLEEGGEAEVVHGEIVSGGYFDVLGLRPTRGRFFLPEEDLGAEGPAVVVLSHGLWRRRFGGDPGLVGRAIRLNGRAFTVVGVAPEEFAGLALLAEPPDLWLPAALHGAVLTGAEGKGFTRRGGRQVAAVARLRPGVGIESARAELEAAARELEREHPEANQGLGLAAVPLAQATIHPGERERYVRSGALLAAVVGLLLLVAGANVANLLLARALARRREIAVRLSLGAGRGRLARQLLAEGALLGLLGGAVGLALAAVGRKVLWALRPPFFPDSLHPALDARVLGFTLAVALGTGLLFGLAPVLQSFRLDLASALTNQAGAMGARRAPAVGAGLRGALVAGQVALSLVVLAGAGLFLRSLAKAEGTDPGFERERLFVIPVDLGGRGYEEARAQEFYRRVVERVSAVPEVRSAAVASRFLLVPGGQRVSLEVEGRQPPGFAGLLIGVNRVGPGYLETAGIPLRAGRGFTAADRLGAVQVAVFNETLARWLWPEGSAVGKRFHFSGDPVPTEVVGVAADARYGDLGEEPQPYVYVPVAQNYSPVMMVHVRTRGDPALAVGAVRREIQALDRSLPLLEARTIGQIRERALWAPRMGAGLLSVFGLLAAALAGLGIYGVVSYSIGQRRREIGIRLAVGAGRPQVLGLVLGQALRPVAAGLAAGLAAALALARLAAGLLFGVTAADPAAFAAATLLLAAVALAAVYLPARRASGLDPVAALRAG